MSNSSPIDFEWRNLVNINEHSCVHEMFSGEFASLLRYPPKAVFVDGSLERHLGKWPLEVIPKKGKKNKGETDIEPKPEYECIGNLRLFRLLLSLPDHSGCVPVRIYRSLSEVAIREHILHDLLVAPVSFIISRQHYRTLGRAWQKYTESATLRPFARPYQKVLGDLLGVDPRCF